MVTIRVVNIRNGQPLPKQRISLSLFYEKEELRPEKYDRTIRMETRINGEAQIRLPEPPPKHLYLFLKMSSKYWHYVFDIDICTQELIQHGKVGPLPDTKTASVPVEAAPGEVIFIARPYTFIERLFSPH
jgi:hypothetical protein